MTNYQCYCYAAKAISNILKEDGKAKLTSDRFYAELYYLWDIYAEEEIEKLIREKEFYNKLF